MLGDAAARPGWPRRSSSAGIYVIAFSYPVVPRAQARIRTQMSAAHSTADLDRAVDDFVAARAATA